MPVRPEPLFVPIVVNPTTGVCSIRTARDGTGGRTGLAFTSAERLASAMGYPQRWTRMGDAALRAALTPLGIDMITLDAELVGPAVSRIPARPALVPGPVAVPAWAGGAVAVAVA